METATPREVNEYDQTLHVWDLPTDEPSLYSLCEIVFTKYWSDIHFGPLVQGAAWEIRAPSAPKYLGMYDGYLTVDFGAWHFHLCIGEHTASGPELGAIRRTQVAQLYRGLGPDGSPTTWGVRMFNGEGTQLCTILLPNPFLTSDQKVLSEPDFGRLAAWDHLRREFLDLAPDPVDRTGKGFAHA